jgi:hypothetical protein
MRRMGFGAAVLVSMVAGGAQAEEKTTVQSLIGQDFQVVGTIVNPTAGPGLFLQKKDKMFFCLLVETTSSPDVGTRYCKPVH